MDEGRDGEAGVPDGTRSSRPHDAEPGDASGAEFDDFYRRSFHGVVALVHGLSGSRFAAEELTQEAFLAAHRRWERISIYDRPEAWVRRVAVNRATSRWRRRAAEARALARLAVRSRPVPEVLSERDEELWAAVRRLPRMQAAAVALHYHDDLPLDEIAEVLGCTEGTVKTHLHRARRTLARTLREDLDEGEAGDEGGDEG